MSVELVRTYILVVKPKNSLRSSMVVGRSMRNEMWDYFLKSESKSLKNWGSEMDEVSQPQ